MVGSALPGLGFLRRLPRLVLDVVLPPQCLGCEAIVDEVGALCPRCWNAIQFIAEPVCAACGVPFAYALGGNALCGACVREQPAFARARAAFVYDDASRRLVLAFKHADRTDAAPAFAEWMARAGAELLADAHVIAPVPLHWTRLFRRRYNQAALLAAALGAKAGVPVAPELIVRRRRTRSQGGLGPSARRRNLAGAFAAPPGGAEAIADRRVLLVDDVLTTGATAGACSRALLKSGAAAVDVLTLARVVRTSAWEAFECKLRRARIERIAFDRNRIAVPVKRADPLDLESVDQIHVVGGSRLSDSDRPRSGLEYDCPSAGRSGVRVLAEIEIYTSPFCGYCYRAKALLDGKGVAYRDINVVFHPAKRREMVDRAAGAGTVPQIFIDDLHVGGSDELAALEAAGRLDRLLDRGDGA